MERVLIKGVDIMDGDYYYSMKIKFKRQYT